MPEVAVRWTGGAWFLEYDGLFQPVVKEQLDAWLAMRGVTRADLRFPSKSLRQRFVHDFGALPPERRGST